MKKKLVFLMAVALMSSVSPAKADGLLQGFEGSGVPSTWILGGTGGFSPAITGLSPTQGSQFAYLTNGPGIDCGNGCASSFPALTDLGLGPQPQADNVREYSTLISSPFILTAGQAVVVDLNYLTLDGGGYIDWAAAYVLAGGVPIALLYYANAGSLGSAVNGLDIHSPGVVLTPDAADFDGMVVGPLGGIVYGPLRDVQYGPETGGSSGWVTSSYAPGPGTYQLQFIVTNTDDYKVASSLAVDNIRIAPVPEPGTLLLLGTGLTGLWLKRSLVCRG